MWGPAMRRVSDVRPLQIAKFAVPPYAGIEQHVDTLARALMPEMRSTVLAGDLVEGRNGREPKPYKSYTVKCYGQINSVYITPRIVPQALSITRIILQCSDLTKFKRGFHWPLGIFY
jgi:hypothetical protein